MFDRYMALRKWEGTNGNLHDRSGATGGSPASASFQIEHG
jgi:hypothetical protein